MQEHFTRYANIRQIQPNHNSNSNSKLRPDLQPSLNYVLHTRSTIKGFCVSRGSLGVPPMVRKRLVYHIKNGRQIDL